MNHFVGEASLLEASTGVQAAEDGLQAATINYEGG